MLEDALKTARMIHRLALGIAVAALVFALSLEKPERESAWVEALQGLERIPFTAYREYALEQAVLGSSWPQSSWAAKDLYLAGDKAMVFGMEELGAALGQPLHVGRLLVENLALSELYDVKLSEIEAVLDLDAIDQPVQVLHPRGTAFLEDIKAFLHEEAATGAYVDRLSMNFDEDLFFTDSFLADPTPLLQLYFEAPSPGVATPVFTGTIPCEVNELGPETSFRSWLLRQAEVEGLLKEEDDALLLLPDLRPYPEGWAERKIGVLQDFLGKAIKAASPEARTISIVSLDIPGSLVLLAVPLSLLALLLYLRAHVRHLSGMAVETRDRAPLRDAIRRFSWLPLRDDPQGRTELWVTLRILPPVACTLLLWRVWSFDTPSAGPLIVMLGGIAATARVGRQLASDFVELRRRAGRPDTPVRDPETLQELPGSEP